VTSSVSGLLTFFPTASLSYVDIFIIFEIFDALKPIMVRDLNLGETNLYKLVDDAVAEHRLTSELHDVYISHSVSFKMLFVISKMSLPFFGKDSLPKAYFW